MILSPPFPCAFCGAEVQAPVPMLADARAACLGCVKDRRLRPRWRIDAAGIARPWRAGRAGVFPISEAR